MRLTIWATLLLALFVSSSAANEEKVNIPLEIGSISIPDSPGFEVLGVSPSSVSRPGSARELAISLLSSSRDGDSDFPRNLAIQFSPFWWSYHPDLSWKGLNLEDKRIGDNLAQTFTFSFATSETKYKVDDEEVEGTGLGLGFRASILKGHVSKKGDEAHKELKKVFQDNVDAIIPDDIKNLPTDSEGNRIIDLEKLSNSEALTKIRRAQEAFRVANVNRVGWQLELAGAASFNFPDDEFHDGDLRNAGGWLTSAYRTDEETFLDSLLFLCVFRYLWNDLDDESFSSCDAGGRIIWISTKDEFPISISGEYVYRYVSGEDKEDSESLKFITEYRVNKTWSIFASLGSSFDPEFEGNEEFVALFGVNFGYGKGPVIRGL
jgi:hypothetical protein